MCHLETHWTLGLDDNVKLDIMNRLKEMQIDDIIEVTPNYVKVNEKGRMFLRNVCMAFDLRLLANKPETRVFSMTI